MTSDRDRSASSVAGLLEEEAGRIPLLVRLGEIDDGTLPHVECGTKFVGEGTITRPGGGYDND